MKTSFNRSRQEMQKILLSLVHISLHLNKSLNTIAEYFLFDLTSAEMSREENMFSAIIRVKIPKN